MNASVQALSISLVSKIAHIPVIFQTEFPSAVVDFSPWLTDETTQQQFDPTSIDLGFSFPRWHPNLSCGCILLQIGFSEKLLAPTCRLVGIEATGHDYQGQHWGFSTLNDWQFEGGCLPCNSSQQQLIHIFSKIHTLFGYPAPLPQ